MPDVKIQFNEIDNKNDFKKNMFLRKILSLIFNFDFKKISNSKVNIF